MAHLITGFKGEEHIQSADHGSFNAAIIGDEQYVLESGNEFEGSILDNNTVRIKDGDLLMYGRHVRINPDSYEDVTIETGTAGKNRIDLICMTYEKNTSDGKETAYLEVIKGEESAGAAVAPSATDGNILNGATKNQMPLYKVAVNGVVLSEITPLFDKITSMSELKKSVANGKEVVANAISEKGVQTATDASFATMATNISNIFTGIDTSDATATAGNILTGKTAYANGVKVTGTMANKSGATQTGTASIASSKLNVKPPANGYYSTSSILTVDVGTATQAQVLNGKTFTSTAGVNKSGTMADKSGTTVTASAVTKDDSYTYLTIPSNGYYNTSSKVKTLNSNLGCDKGGFTLSTTNYTVSLGYKPSIVILYTSDVINYYDSTRPTKIYRFKSDGTLETLSIGNTNASCIGNITDTGFVVNKRNSGTLDCTYVAVK